MMLGLEQREPLEIFLPLVHVPVPLCPAHVRVLRGLDSLDPALAVPLQELQIGLQLNRRLSDHAVRVWDGVSETKPPRVQTASPPAGPRLRRASDPWLPAGMACHQRPGRTVEAHVPVRQGQMPAIPLIVRRDAHGEYWLSPMRPAAVRESTEGE